jgi:hypothetical protein
MTAADNDAWTDDDLSNAVKVYPVQTPEQVRTLRARLGLRACLSEIFMVKRHGLAWD